MQSVRRFFRANPQALVLLIVCLVLGIGTFVVVVIAVGESGSGTPSGEPSGAVTPLLALFL